MLMNVFEGILIPFVGTTLGAACVVFYEKKHLASYCNVHLQGLQQV